MILRHLLPLRTCILEWVQVFYFLYLAGIFLGMAQVPPSPRFLIAPGYLANPERGYMIFDEFGKSPRPAPECVIDGELYVIIEIKDEATYAKVHRPRWENRRVGRLHRLADVIWCCCNNAKAVPSGKVVGFENGNKLDCRKSNLKLEDDPASQPRRRQNREVATVDA